MTELDRQIVTLRGQGLTYDEISQALGVRKRRIKDRIRTLIRRGLVESKADKLRPATVEKFLAMVHGGFSWADIGNQLGLSKVTVRKWRARFIQEGRLDLDRRAQARFTRQQAPRCDRCGLRLDLGRHEDHNVRVPQVEGKTCFWCRVELNTVSPDKMIELLADCRHN